MPTHPSQYAMKLRFFGAPDQPSTSAHALFFVFEGQRHPRAERRHLAVLDLYVHFRDFGSLRHTKPTAGPSGHFTAVMAMSPDQGMEIRIADRDLCSVMHFNRASSA